MDIMGSAVDLHEATLKSDRMHFEGIAHLARPYWLDSRSLGSHLRLLLQYTEERRRQNFVQGGDPGQLIDRATNPIARRGMFGNLIGLHVRRMAQPGHSLHHYSR